MYKFQKHRAISPAITTLILLGVAVAGGFLAWSQMQSTAATVGQSANLKIETVSLVKQSNGQEWLSVTVKNVGNKQLTGGAVSLQVDTDSGTGGIQPFTVNLTPATLNPGQTSSASALVVDTAGASITSQNFGDSIIIEATASGPDGSTVRHSSSVTVSTG